ncbi:hypothetical protein NDU88_004429 [Pleurodeles waltl]|uniref:Uncharacterized protein n=1 Tax=Pleurodeles waltl TaxID=8319 RepID=A0AAV7RFP9_PLEWA|nr:hypothetical protein NDU88_004429 [Pleurodeles waltl]
MQPGYHASVLSERLLDPQTTTLYLHHEICDARGQIVKEALMQAGKTITHPEVHPPVQPHTMVDQAQETTMDYILKEISVVGRRQGGMDNMMASLMEEINAPGYCRLSVKGDEPRVAHDNGGSPRHLLRGQRPGTSVSPQQDNRLGG